MIIPGWPYSEILADECKQTAADFWVRARGFFAAYCITVKRVLTDNGSCYRSKVIADALSETHTGIKGKTPIERLCVCPYVESARCRTEISCRRLHDVCHVGLADREYVQADQFPNIVKASQDRRMASRRRERMSAEGPNSDP